MNARTPDADLLDAPAPDARPFDGGTDAWVDALAAEATLQRAIRRGRSAGLAHAGDVSPRDAWLLHRAGVARLVDVRTEAEWTFVGRVEGVPLVEWRAFGAREPNADFLERLRAHVPPDVPVLFLCRSGVRSRSAAQAATRAGWRAALNVLEGFEGELDAHGRRGALDGWRRAGLPWVQS
ncbi:MAG TPA: rhodanese-like domain-containing protein [Burkholderiaceae bacterium]|nr:rhodanese-like domain-containing protein [Burkholderiaceae bacterium]